MMEILVKIFAFFAGVTLVYITLASAVRTFVLPRGDNVRLTRWIFSWTMFIFSTRALKARTYRERDRIMALFAPTALLITPIVWVVLIMIGYACIYWALGVGTPVEALTLSGSSLLTLGTVPFIAPHITLIEFSEATLGLGIVALLISYLPTMYSAFSQREAKVQMLEVRAGSPPSAVEMISRLHRIRGLDGNDLNETWKEWEIWFTQVEETHTSLGALSFFRSQKPENSWITAAGTILDAAALIDSTIDVPYDPHSNLTLRAGFIALRSIADFFRIPYDPDPTPDSPISINQEEYNEVCAELEAMGVPLRPDREATWRSFKGWRVNYDVPLIRIATLIHAPYAPWISDRSVPTSVQDKIEQDLTRT